MKSIYNLSLIKDLCVEKKISQRELARRVGMTISGIQRIIKKNSTTPQTLYKIAEALDVNPDVFMTKSDTREVDLVHEDAEKYDYKEKYIQLLEEQNRFLKDKLEKKEKENCASVKPNKENSKK